MERVIFLIVAAAIAFAIWRMRSGFARERKTVMARLDAERSERGDYSPTAELFREAGVRHDPDGRIPIDMSRVGFVEPPEDPADILPELDLPMAPPTEDELVIPAGDLRQLLKGISMPAGLRPLGPLVPENASFVTDAPATEVHEGLDSELARLGCSARWVEPTVAEAERNGERGLITIYADPTAAVDLEGSPLFPEVSPGSVVVRMLAL
jgi:hypothetical protein